MAVSNYIIPGVYIEENDAFARSVPQVSTAVPAFLGYTAKNGGQVKRISSILEFREFFGLAQAVTVTGNLSISNSGGNLTVEPGYSSALPSYVLEHLLEIYFANGGGPCWVISVNPSKAASAFPSSPSKDDYLAGLKVLETLDEPTLIVLTDALKTLPLADYWSLCTQGLAQCAAKGDRFLIMDVPYSPSSTFGDFKNSIELSRTNLGTLNLSYGAAYYPYLEASLQPRVNLDSAKISGGDLTYREAVWASSPTSPDKLIAAFSSFSGAAVPGLEFVLNGSQTAPIDIASDKAGNKLTISVKGDTAIGDIASAFNNYGGDKMGLTLDLQGASDSKLTLSAQTPGFTFAFSPSSNLTNFKLTRPAIYKVILQKITPATQVIPPAPAIAGVYCQVDRSKGVWNAPANVSLGDILRPSVLLSKNEQALLAEAGSSGKSINTILQFEGKGTLVWGARTLAANDLNWRYIQVRRLFIMAEESIQKACQYAVFETNDATTWTKVKVMIDNFLYSLWSKGGLAGSKPEEAYRVTVGLGQSMTQQDILEGKLIVNVAMAPVRPAEFIILRFEQMMQTT